MKYQVFLKKDDKMCSITIEAKNKKDAEIKAIKQGKGKYNLDFKVFKIFAERS
jgi:hypothetical protein